MKIAQLIIISFIFIGCAKNEFDIIDITIKNETTPVSKPTKRGGVYFSDTTVYKINAVINENTNP